MNIRAIRKLLQLKDEHLFSEISQGMIHIVDNVNRLDRSASRLAKLAKPGQSIHKQSTALLKSIAEEEATKLLILMDFLRCPNNLGNARSRQLGYFYDHLAKGIYAKVYELIFDRFLDIQVYCERERKTFYFDGQQGFEWIFYNKILSEREDKFYVNYKDWGNGSQCSWETPRIYTFGYFDYPRPAVLIANAFNIIGALSPNALRTIASHWHEIQMTADCSRSDLLVHNSNTLKTLSEQNHLSADSKNVQEYICEKWQFPLYCLELKMEQGSLADIHNFQKLLEEEWMLQEIEEPDY